MNHSVPRPIGPEMDREGARDRVDRVERERPAQHQARVVARPDVDELAGARAGDEARGVVRLEPLAGQDLATVEQLGAGQPHRRRAPACRRAGGRARVSSAGRHRTRTSASGRRWRQRVRVGVASSSRLVAVVLVVFESSRSSASPPSSSSASGSPSSPASPRRRLGRDGRVRVGDRLGEVAEDVRRVVVADDLVRAGDVLPGGLALGDDAAAEAARRRARGARRRRRR